MFWCAQTEPIFSMEKAYQRGHSSFKNQGIHLGNQTDFDKKSYLKISGTIAAVATFIVLKG